MKTKFNGILTLLLAFVVQLTFAQTKTVSGNVSDETGPLPGVSIIVEGTSSGTETDFDGNYSIEANTGDVLQYSFVGMTTQSVTIGDSDTINVTLESDSLLDEVVVTAFGIKREKKALGYAATQVSGDVVSDAKEANFINSLAGKVAGLDIKKSNTLGGSTNVILRGFTSLGGNNQALFVVDGTPISNANTNATGQNTGRGGYDYGNAAMDINPDDIESMTILKGAAASNLYGSRGANGVIIITTKKGKSQKGLGITINSGVTWGKYDEDTFPKYQKEFGAGYGPYYGSTGYFFDQDIDGDGNLDLTTVFTEDASFGAAFDPSLLVYQWDAFYPESDNYLTATPWVAAENGAGSVFRTAFSTSNSISVDGGTDTSTFRLGFTKLVQQGILPNSELKRSTVTFNGSHNFTDKLSADITTSYTQTKGKGRNGTGYNANNLMQSFRQWSQTNVDYADQKEAYFRTGRNITWNYAGDPLTSDGVSPIFFDNPYWVLHENYETDERSRIFGNVSLNYKINDVWSVMGRAAVDSYAEIQEERTAVGSVNTPQYSRYNRNYTEGNYDLIVSFDQDFGEKINLSGIIGATTRTTDLNTIFAATTGGLVVPKLYSLSNSASPMAPPTESDWKTRKNGYFANASFGYDNTIYVDLSGRIDESSTLPSENNTYAYWAVSSSLIFSKYLEADWLTFGKLRANYATVGNDASAGRVFDVYANPTNYGSTPLFSVANTKNNADLKNELSKQFEVGLEMSFLDRRVGFDFSFYDTKTTNQILAVAITPATGSGFKYINAGEIDNTGYELQVYGSPVRNDDFEWRINANWYTNDNEVVELVEGIDNLQITSSQGGVSINATVGEAFGSIWGTNFTYLNGEKVIDATTGRYVVDNTTQPIGNQTPDWKAGITNMVSYKDFSLSFLIDIQKGGDVFSLDTWYGYGTGVYDITAGLNELGNPKRDPVADGGGVLFAGVNPDGSQNTTRTRMDYYANALGWTRAPNALHVYDASYVKLREVVLTYNLPSNIIEKLPINSLSFSAVGRNLWIISKNMPYSDPEAGLSSGNSQGYQSSPAPATKEIGLNLKLEF